MSRKKLYGTALLLISFIICHSIALSQSRGKDDPDYKKPKQQNKKSITPVKKAPPFTISKFLLTASDGYCSGSNGVNVELFSSQKNVVYQLFNEKEKDGPEMEGTQAVINFGIKKAGSYYVLAKKLGTDSFSVAMNDTVIIKEYSLPSVQTVEGGGNFYYGERGIEVSLSGSEKGVTYDLYKWRQKVDYKSGTGSRLNFGLQKEGTYTIVAVNNFTNCKIDMAGSATVKVSEKPYETFIAGNKIWMNDNLNAEYYRDGTKIPEAISKYDWVNYGNQKQGCWCYYDNQDHQRGKLYNWYAITDSRGLAPYGWRIPYKEDFGSLNKWNGIFGGTRDGNGEFKNLNNSGYWWSIDNCKVLDIFSPDKVAVFKQEYISSSQFGITLICGTYQMNGFSVRCVKE